MAAKKDELRDRMAAVAARRTSPDARPAPSTAIRTKPVRVTLDLDPADYSALNRWISLVGPRVDPDFPRLSLADALRGMIRATITDETMTGQVVGQIRQDRGK
jgi:hypothetical protein